MSRDFTRLVAAATISNFGSMLTAIALPIAAIALLGATPAQIATLNAAAILPGIALGLFAAHGIDRVRRRPVLITADLARAALLVALPAAAFAGVLTMAQVIAFAFCRGLLRLRASTSPSTHICRRCVRAARPRARERPAAGG